jgi:hypothetical protein
VRQGSIDPKAPESLTARVHACWLSPLPTQAPNASSAASPPAAGTTPKTPN